MLLKTFSISIWNVPTLDGGGGQGVGTLESKSGAGIKRFTHHIPDMPYFTYVWLDAAWLACGGKEIS